MLEVIFREIPQMTMSSMLNMGMVALLAWFISQYAKSNTPKFIMSILGLYFISTALKTDSILFNPSTFFGLGLLIPHIAFFIKWMHSVIETIKLITIDSYTFFLTVYYKTRNILLWFVLFYEKIQGLFSERKNKQSYEEHYKDKGYDYKENSRHEHSKSYKKESYQEKAEQKQHKSYQNNENKKTYTQSNTNHEKNYNSKYAQFYSTDHYVVLGISPSSTMKEIKKAYRTLSKQYHPDINMGMADELTPIFQKINNSYQHLKQHHN